MDNAGPKLRFVHALSVTRLDSQANDQLTKCLTTLGSDIRDALLVEWRLSWKSWPRISRVEVVPLPERLMEKVEERVTWQARTEAGKEVATR